MKRALQWISLIGVPFGLCGVGLAGRLLYGCLAPPVEMTTGLAIGTIGVAVVGCLCFGLFVWTPWLMWRRFGPQALTSFAAMVSVMALAVGVGLTDHGRVSPGGVAAVLLPICLYGFLRDLLIRRFCPLASDQAKPD